MNKLIAIGLGTAAVVVAVFIGAQVFGSPNAVPSPSLGAEPDARPFALFDGSLDEMGGPPVTVTIPASGWAGVPGSGILIKNEDPAPPAGAGFIGPFTGD